MAIEKIELIAKSQQDTEKLAEKLAQITAGNFMYLLYGDLGAGKSVFCRSFIRTLAGKDIDVPSPTFTLVQTYELSDMIIWHFDLYRIEQPDEVYELGWEEAVSDGISLVEWPERLGNIVPPINNIQIKFQILPDESRNITVLAEKQIIDQLTGTMS